MIVNNGLRACTATWWALDGQWRCVGAMKPLSKFCSWISPEKADKAARQQGFTPVWRRRINPANKGRLFC